MKFVVSDTHVKRQTRKAIWVGLLLAVMITGCITSLFRAEKISSMFIPLVGTYVFAQWLWAQFKQVREGAASYPVIELNEMAGELAVSHQDVTVTMRMDQIKGLRLQYKSGELKSILLKTTSIGTARFEGYEQLTVLADKLKQHVPTEQITQASFYHQ